MTFLRITQRLSLGHYSDVFVVAGLTALVFVTCYDASGRIAFNIWDLWFEANIPRNFSNMVAIGSDHSRSNLHPLFSLLLYPPTRLLRKVFHLDAVLAVRLMLSLTASIWVSLVYLVLRTVGSRTLDAGLLGLLAAMSAAAIFWLPVPETYPFGSCT